MGTLLGKQIGAYKINKLLGKGGMGEVYLATDEHLDRYAALKVLKPELSSDENFIKRFSQEAKTLAQLNHPHIATLYTILKDQNQFIMAMEYIDGIPFDEYLKEKAPLTTVETLPIIIAVLDGLQHAHSKGIVHRDLKPSNIMFNKSGTVKVMDFGIARGQTDDRHTKTGMIIGTLDYMAPELIKGEEATFSSDLYAIGIMLYQVLSNKFPFSTTSEYSLMQAHIQTKPIPIQQHNPNLSKGLIRYINQLLQKQPGKRFPSTQAALDELRKIYEKEKSLAAKPAANLAASSAASPSWQIWLKDHWQKLAFAASILLLLGIGFNQFKPGNGVIAAGDLTAQEPVEGGNGFPTSTFQVPTATPEQPGALGTDPKQKTNELVGQAKELANQKKYLGDYPSLYLVALQILEKDKKNALALAWIEEIIQHYFLLGKKAYGAKNKTELQEAINVLENIAAEDKRTAEIKGLWQKMNRTRKPAAQKERSRPEAKKPRNVPREIVKEEPRNTQEYTPPTKVEREKTPTRTEEKVKPQEPVNQQPKNEPDKQSGAIAVKSGQAISLRIMEEINTDMPLKIGQHLKFELAEPLGGEHAGIRSKFRINAKITKYKPKSKKAMIEIKISSILGPQREFLAVKRGTIFLTADKKNESLIISKGSTFKVFAARNLTFKY